MKNLLLFLLLLPITPTFSQEFNTRYYGNNVGAEWTVTHSAALSDGGCIATGTANTPIGGGYRVFLMRSDNQGNLLWTRTLLQGKANFVTPAPDNGFIIGGQTEKTPFGKTDGFVTKTDANGTVQWTTLLQLNERGEVTCVRPTPDGGYVLCGNVVTDITNGQDVFYAMLNGQGALSFYEEKGTALADQARDIIVTKVGNLVLSWTQNNFGILTRFSSNGQQEWEKNLNFDFQYYPFSFSNGLNVTENTLGDLYVAGGYEAVAGLSGYQPQVLRLSYDGDLLQRINHPDLNGCPAVFLSDLDGSMTCFYTKFQSSLTTSTLIRLSINAQGSLVARDSSIVPTGRIVQIMTNGKTRLLVRPFAFYENSTQISVLQASGNQYTVADTWNFNSNREPSHDYYRTGCRLTDGGYLVLKQTSSDTGVGYNFYVFKTDANGSNATDPVLLSEAFYYQTPLVRLVATPDGGALAYLGKTDYWKLDATGHVIWQKQLNPGFLLEGPDNNFAILETRYQWKQGQVIRLWRYNSDGNLLEEKTIPTEEKQGYLFGGISRLDGGYTLWGGRVTPDNIPRNWVAYLDPEGNLVSDVTLDSSDFYVSANSMHFLRTSTVGLLVAGLKYHDSSNVPTDAAYLVRVENDKIMWDYTIGELTGERFVDIRDIEEVPCQGFVLSLDVFEARSNVRLPYPAAETACLLHQITDDGHGGAFFIYHALPSPETPDTSFIPGYTFRQWGDELHGQTRDVYFRTISFPAHHPTPTFETNVGIFPNPSGNEVCFQLDAPENGRLTIDIFDAAGRLLDRFFSEKYDASWMTGYAARYPAGNYVVRVTTPSGERFTGKWVKGN